MATRTKRTSARDRRRVRRSGRPNARGLYYFDKAAADRACGFFPRFLIHTKGEWAGQPFVLEEWQKRDIIRPIFGWKRRADGLRRYRTVYIEVGRKNGKSTLVAGIGLYLLHCDDEPGAEIYSLAADRFQAAIVFDQARAMSRASSKLAERSEIYRREIFVPSTRSYYRVLSSDVPTKQGLNPHGILFDELHVQDNREMWDTLRTGRGARRQPLTIAMTTAGFDKKSLCGRMHDRALSVAKGSIKDDSFLPVIYAIRKGESWRDPKVWARCNPNLGVSIQPNYLKNEYEEAKDSPAFQNTFRRFHLDEWLHQVVRWIDMKKWEACTGSFSYKELAVRLRGKPCWAGLDLSTVTDLSALVLLFDSTIGPNDPDYPLEKDIDNGKAAPTKTPSPDDTKELVKLLRAIDGKKPDLPKIPGWEYGDPLPAYDVLCWFWCPEEGIHLRSKKDRMPYDLWRDEGALNATEGDAVDHGAIRKKIQTLGKLYLIQQLAVDAWNAHKLITELEQEDGFVVARVSQGFGSITAPTKELDVLYRRQQLRHGGHPVLSWCADNVSLDKDAHDNWKPSKKKSRERIDGIVALVMALSRALVDEDRIEDFRGIEAI